MLFEELNKTRRIAEPEERKPEQLKRAKAPTKKRRMKASSVSLRTANITLAILGVIGGLLIAAGIVYVSYLGFNLYVNG